MTAAQPAMRGRLGWDVQSAVTRSGSADASAALRSAFGLTGEEFALILADLGFDATQTALNLENVSAIFRRGQAYTLRAPCHFSGRRCDTPFRSVFLYDGASVPLVVKGVLRTVVQSRSLTSIFGQSGKLLGPTIKHPQGQAEVGPTLGLPLYTRRPLFRSQKIQVLDA